MFLSGFRPDGGPDESDIGLCFCPDGGPDDIGLWFILAISSCICRVRIGLFCPDGGPDGGPDDGPLAVPFGILRGRTLPADASDVLQRFLALLALESAFDGLHGVHGLHDIPEHDVCDVMDELDAPLRRV